MTNLKIADGLSLPLDVVTQTIAILAKRRAGKSYTMRRLFEQLFKAGQQVVLVDPKGDQWGVRSAANGKDPGLPIVILGGERGDVPLEPGSGEIIAKLIVEERISALLDLSLFRKHEVATFMTSFMETLYRLKAREIYRTPMMLVIDEADAIAPQKPQKGEERMLGAAEDIVRRGGQRGIGCVLVTQRSAVLNKNVLTQAQILVVLRTIAPQDLKAMEAWIDVHGDEEQGETLMESLPSLPTGDAWFWSPGWPTIEGIFKRVHVLPIDTFDSGASPKPGVKRVEPKNLADIDLDALKGHMAATIEKAKADDPKRLKADLATARAENVKLKAAAEKPACPAPEALAAAKAAGREAGWQEGYHTGRSEVADKVYRLWEPLRDAVGAVAKAADAFDAGNREIAYEERLTTVRTAHGRPIPAPTTTRAFHTTSRAAAERIGRENLAPAARVAPAPHATIRSGNPDIGNTGKRRILIALAQNHEGLTDRKLSILTGIARSGGTWRTYMGDLRTRGLVDSGGGSNRISDEGRNQLGHYDPLPVGQALVEYWRGRLGDTGKRKLFDACVAAYPASLTTEQLAERSGIEPTGGTWRTYMGQLRSLELLVGKGEIKANEELFE